MSSISTVSSFVLMGTLVLAGAGCQITPATQGDGAPAQPPAAATVQPEMMPPMMPHEQGIPDGGGTGMMKQSPPPELTEEQKTEVAAGEASHQPKDVTFHITAGSFYFVPNMMTVKKGDKVKIVFNNAGGMHNFVLDEFKVRIDPIQGGETQTVEFTADKAGTFEYYCGVGNHRQMGQKGQLVVTE